MKLDNDGFAFEGDTLCLKGIRLSVIKQACGENLRKLYRKRWLQPMLDLAHAIPQPYFHLPGHDRIEVLWRTLLADHSLQLTNPQPGGEHPAPRYLRDGFVANAQNVLAHHLAEIGPDSAAAAQVLNAHRVFDTLTGRPMISSVKMFAPLIQRVERGQSIPQSAGSLLNIVNRAANHFAAVAGQFWFHRSLFITEDGHFGLGPESAAEKDEVWILFGAQVPFVLRPAPERGPNAYTLVGEAYVHGFMEGEALHGRSSSEREPVRLV